jgi:hypothetical protein
MRCYILGESRRTRRCCQTALAYVADQSLGSIATLESGAADEKVLVSGLHWKRWERTKRVKMVVQDLRRCYAGKSTIT